jgi:hypothetical protein
MHVRMPTANLIRRLICDRPVSLSLMLYLFDSFLEKRARSTDAERLSIKLNYELPRLDKC